MRRFVFVCALLAAVAAAGSTALALAGRGGEPAQAATRGDPGAFVRRLVVQIVRDDYARAWLTLHPAHKAVAPRWTYVDCELLSPVPGYIASLEIVRVADKPVRVPGAGRLTTKAVTFRLVLHEPALDEDVEVTHTSHLVAVRGHWRWLLTPGRYELYRAGACGATAPSA